MRQRDNINKKEVDDAIAMGRKEQRFGAFSCPTRPIAHESAWQGNWVGNWLHLT